MASVKHSTIKSPGEKLRSVIDWNSEHVIIGLENSLTFSYPLSRAADTISLGYNLTNLKVTANQLNTIQDLSTASSPTFANITDTGLTASNAVLTDANKKLVSQAMTGTGNMVRATNPTLAAATISEANKLFFGGTANWINFTDETLTIHAQYDGILEGNWIFADGIQLGIDSWVFKESDTVPYAFEWNQGSEGNNAFLGVISNPSMASDEVISTGWGNTLSGTITIRESTSSSIGHFLIMEGQIPIPIYDSGGYFSTVKDTPGKMNFYWEVSQYKLQNKNSPGNDVKIMFHAMN